MTPTLGPDGSRGLYLSGNKEQGNAIKQAVVLCPPERTELPSEVLPLALGGQVWAGAAIDSKEPLTLAEVELRHIRDILHRTGGNKSEAARLLAIDYKALLRKISG